MERAALSACARELRKLAEAPPPAEHPVMEKLRQKAKEMGVPIQTYLEVAKGNKSWASQLEKATGGGMYTHKSTIALNDKADEAVLAHELGHADFQRSLLGKVLQSPHARVLHPVGTMILPISALAAAISLSPTLASASLHAASPFMLSAPTLIGEGVATYKGLQYMKDAGATEEDMARARSKLLQAFGSYAQRPIRDAALLSGVYLGRHLMGMSHYHLRG